MIEGNFIQLIAAILFCGFILGVGVWQLVSTSLAKRRRIARERAVG